MNGIGCVIILIGVLIIGGGIYFISTQSATPIQQVAATNPPAVAGEEATTQTFQYDQQGQNKNAQTSDPQESQVQSNNHQNEETWTPEKINKEPVKYLTEMLAEAQAALEKLKAVEIDLQTRYKKYYRISLEKQSDAEGAKIVLEKAKTAYREAQEHDEWPAKFYVRKYEQEKLEEIIVELNNISVRAKALADKYDSLTILLQTKIKLLKKKFSSIKETVTQINHNLEIVRTGEMMKDVSKTMEETNVSLDISDILADRELNVAMADLVQVEAQAAADKKAFTAIMGQ